MNNITIELCAEDRARIDKLTAALTVLASAKAEAVKSFVTAPSDNNDDINAMLKKVLNDTPKNTQEAPKASEHPTLDPFPEAPTAKAEASEAPVEKAKPAVTMEMLRSKAITLSAAGKKDQVRAVVQSYATKVTDVPKDKWAEVYEKLTALEG